MNLEALIMDSFEHYTREVVKDFLPKWRYERNRPDLMPPKEQGRNEKCNCGSGKKYKCCCGERK
jgi:uncharacterized protein YchJ